MTKRLPPLLLIIILISRFVPASAAGINYSADLESVSPAGRFTSKIYVMDGLQRMDMASGGRQAITILRGDKKVVWMLMPESRLYAEMPLDKEREILPPFTAPGISVEKEFLGEETVEGHPAKKYHVNIMRKGKKQSSGFVWEAVDLNGLPVKFQTEDGSITMTWKHILMGGAERSLFEIPSGYKKIEVNIPGVTGGNTGR